MKQEINRFTAHTNCPPGEYLAIFTNSKVFKYPRGEREILSFLILKDENTPLINNKCKAYYSVIVCNKTKGVSTKSKITKIKLAMLNKDEYDPLSIHIGLPGIESFYDRREHIEMEYEGGFIKDPRKLYSQLRYKVPKKDKDSIDEAFNYLLNIENGILLDEKGNFKHDIDYNSDQMRGQDSFISNTHKKILKFLDTQDLSILFGNLR